MSSSKRLSFLIGFLFLVLLPAGLALAQSATPTPAAQGIATYNNTVWSYVQNTSGVVTVWKVSLSLVDLIVVGGLLVAAFANIFRFRIDIYGVKQILPGLIIGIILANLSFFIMRLFIESATIFTQFIGNIVQGYAGGTLGDQQVGIYLARRAQELLFNSLWAIPGLSGYVAGTTIGAATGGITAGIFFGAGLPVIIGAVGGVVLLAFGLLLLTLLPLVLFLILLFLLYIRNYILIALFMVSPLAFFSLGFPPLRKYWQLWWGNFWKWLLMPMASFAIVGFMIIFLNAANVTEAGTHRNYLDYFFFNGIAILLLFAANRVPFMWGSFFGQNVMGQWAGLGKLAGTGIKETARAGTNSVYEKRIIPAQTQRRLRKLDPLTTTNMDIEASKHGVIRKSGQSDADFMAAIQKKREDNIKDDLKRYNPVNFASGVRQGYEQRIKYWNERKERQGRTSGTFASLAGREQAYRFFLADNRERINSIESFDQANADLYAIARGQYDEDQLERLRKTPPSAMVADPDFINIPPEQLANANLLVGRVQNLGRQRNASTKSVIRLETEAMTEYYQGRNPAHPLPAGARSLPAGEKWKPGDPERPFELEPFRDYRARSPHGGDEGDDDGPVTSPSSASQPLGANPAVPQSGNKRAGTLQDPTVPTAAYLQSLEALVTASTQMRIPDRVVDKVISRVRKRLDSGAGGALTASSLGISPQQFSAIKQPLSKYVNERKSFAQSVDSGSKETQVRTSQLDTASVLAKHISGTQPTEIKGLRTQLDSYIGDLSKTATNERLGEIQVGLSKIHPAAGVGSSNTDPAEMQTRLLESARNSRDAVSLLSDETMQHAVSQGADVDTALKQTVRVRKLKEQIALDTVNSVDTIRQNAGQVTSETVQTPEVTAPISANITHLIEFHPALHEAVEGLNLQQQQQVAAIAAQKFAASVANTVTQKAQNIPEGTSVEAAIQDDYEQEALSKQLIDIVQKEITDLKAQSSAPVELEPDATAAPAPATEQVVPPASPTAPASPPQTPPPAQT